MKVGITFSTFDLFHAGHVLMLKEAKESCDHLIAGIQTDPTIDRPDTKNKPIQSIVERQIQLESCKYVDSVIVYETEKDIEDILKSTKLDVRIIGVEYTYKEFTGKDICNDKEIKIVYNSRGHDWSTTELRERMGNSTTKQLKPKLSPSVRKMVAENNLDVLAIPLSREDGRITKADIISYMERTILTKDKDDTKPSALGKTFDEQMDEKFKDSKYLSYKYSPKEL